MRVKILASGSKGNCTYVECGSTKFLIDVGINFLQVKKELEAISVDINSLDFILLTHTHSDHIKGLKTLVSKTNIKVCASLELIEELKDKFNLQYVTIIYDCFDYKGIDIKLIPLSHDVPCYGFNIKYEDNKLVYITDTGYLNRRYFSMISNADVYIIESNHDEKILMNGNYPYILKQRIIGDKGHLSNSMAASILKKVIGYRTKYIFLAHLSEENNTKELAFDEFAKCLQETDFDIERLIVTDQYLSTGMVEIL